MAKKEHTPLENHRDAFNSDDALAKAQEYELGLHDLSGCGPSGENGYTINDVQAAIQRQVSSLRSPEEHREAHEQIDEGPGTDAVDQAAGNEGDDATSNAGGGDLDEGDFTSAAYERATEAGLTKADFEDIEPSGANGDYTVSDVEKATSDNEGG